MFIVCRVNLDHVAQKENGEIPVFQEHKEFKEIEDRKVQEEKKVNKDRLENVDQLGHKEIKERKVQLVLQERQVLQVLLESQVKPVNLDRRVIQDQVYVIQQDSILVS